MVVAICGKCQFMYRLNGDVMTNNEIGRMSDEIASIESRIMGMTDDISYIKREVLLSRLMLAIFFLITLAVLLFLK